MEMNLIEGVLKKLDRNEAPTVEESLKLLNHTSVSGSVLIVDETQSLIDYRKGTPAGDCAANIIRTLANAGPRSDAGVPRVTIMMFGTGDTREVVRDLGSYDPVDERLAALPQNSVETLMREHIRIGAGSDSGLSLRANDLWVKPLVDEFGDWTRHAAGAARSCEAMLEKFKWEAVDESWGWPALLRLADRTRNRVYERMHEDADGNGVKAPIPDTVLQALVRQPDGKLGKQKFAKLMRTTIDRVYGKGTATQRWGDTKHTFETMMTRGLRRAGLIDDVLTVAGEATGFIHAPVPSTLAFATAYPPDDMQEVLEHVQAAGIPVEPVPAKHSDRK